MSETGLDLRRRLQSKNVTLLVAAFLLSFINTVSALSITLHDKECISESVLHEGDLVSGNFVVTDHEIFWSTDHPGIDFTATSPTGVIMHSLKGTSGDKFQFKASKTGTYKFCFINPSGTPESVSFYIHIGHIPDEHDVAKDEHLDPIHVKIGELNEALESIVAEQKYLRAREWRHRYTNDSTRSRVVFYTIAEYIALLVSSGFQVFYIRRLFGKSFAYNRV